MPALCVSIHDVAPATWKDCQRVIAAVQAVAPIPLTLLVVPRWHDLPDSQATDFYAQLNCLRNSGNELVLHGYTHLDAGPPPRNLLENFKRRVLTRSEGEFAALGAMAARQRIAAGLQWFAHQGWDTKGFIAPAWMMSEATMEVLTQTSLSYASSYGALIGLPHLQKLHAPALVYTARYALGDALVRTAISQLAAFQTRKKAALIRLGLHPADARNPATLAHMQRLIASLLPGRFAMTKSTFVQSWQAASVKIQ